MSKLQSKQQTLLPMNIKYFWILVNEKKKHEHIFTSKDITWNIVLYYLYLQNKTNEISNKVMHHNLAKTADC